MTGTAATTIDVVNRCPDYTSYRAARVKSLFNVDAGNEFPVRAVLPLHEMPDWNIGVIVGPSGSGKSTIGRALWDGAAWHEPGEGWDPDAPIIDCVDPGGDFDAATGALSAVGLGDVPAWLRPYHVLSTGQKFRADLARIVAEAPERVVVDEFTSTVDRQIAKIGAGAFAKSWKRTGHQAVLLTCHYDVLDWLEPDWVYDTGSGVFEFTRGCLQRPRLDVDIRVGTWSVWPYFEPHHYLKDAGKMPFAKNYVAEVEGQAVAHLGVSSRGYKQGNRRVVAARACRLVVLPEWQGAGVGMRFLNAVAEMYLSGQMVGRHLQAACTTEFHTSHPGLAAALRRDRRWRQMSSVLYGGAKGSNIDKNFGNRVGYGGHFRAVQGFRYFGQAGLEAAS